MTRSRRFAPGLVVALALGLAACAKGGTSLDEEAAQSPSVPNTSAPASNNGGSGGSGDAPCGNGALDPGEDCDGGNLNGATCVTLGFDGGQLTCDPVTCMFETSMCTREQPSMGTAGSGP